MIINELTRKDIINRSKSQNKDRFNRRLSIRSYNLRLNNINVPLYLLTGTVEIPIMLDKYRTIISIPNVSHKINAEISSGRELNYKLILECLNYCIDNYDLKVDCSCPDFKYRYAYTATRLGYKQGSPENRPSPSTNPSSEGSVCKHILFLLANKKWVNRYAALLNVLFKLHPELLNKV